MYESTIMAQAPDPGRARHNENKISGITSHIRGSVKYEVSHRPGHSDVSELINSYLLLLPFLASSSFLNIINLR